jgi:hypothetical protein
MHRTTRRAKPCKLQYFRGTECTGVRVAKVALGVFTMDDPSKTREEPVAGPAAPDASTEPDPSDERLATIRLPPVPRPPQASRVSVSPPSSGLGNGTSSVPTTGGSIPPAKNWLQSLIGPSHGLTPWAAERLNRRRLAAASALIAFALVIAALFIGLSAPPVDSVLPSMVLAAMVIGRALVALGMLWAALGLLTMGERWLTLGVTTRRDFLEAESSNRSGPHSRE